MVTFITDDFIIEPLGIMYLASMLKNNGYSVKLLKTFELCNKSVLSPIVAYSVTTGNQDYYANINLSIKNSNPNIISIFGGPHCTFEPAFAQTLGVDYLFRGECFNPIVEFVNKVAGGKDVTDTNNLAYCNNGQLVCNPLLPQIDIDSMPLPDRTLIYRFKKNRNNRIRNVIASMYCPMNCSYCFNKQFKALGYKPQIRMVDSVINECAQLIKNYPTELIYFQDDIFPIYLDNWLNDFCNKYKATVNTPFHIHVRIEMLNEHKIKMLKNAGLHGVTFAIESANESVREHMLNRREVSNEIIIRNSRLLSKYGIKFRIENMVGIPSETILSALNTLDLNLQCKPTVGWASIFTPYYGTDLGELCRDKNLIKDNPQSDFFTSSQLKLVGRYRIERLQKLFGLTCYLPVLRRIVPFLTLLPFRYRWLSRFTRKRLYKTRLFKV